MPYYAGDYYAGDVTALARKGVSMLASHLPAIKKALPFAAAAGAGALAGAGLEAAVAGGEERRRHRRMNPFNFSAARRAIRRLSSFQRHAQKLYRFTGPRSRFKRPRKRR